MFATLLKYEFKNSCKILIPINIGNLLVGSFGYILLFIALKFFESGDENIASFGVMFLLLWIGLVLITPIFSVACMIILSLQFYRNKFTDQGYLTFTLPATSHQILISSLLNFFFWNLLNTIITASCYVLMVLPAVMWLVNWLPKIGLTFADFWEILTMNFSELLPSGALFTVGNIVYAIGGLFYAVMLPYLAITIGSTIVKRYKLLLSAGIALGMHLVFYVVTIVLEFIESIASTIILAETGNLLFFTNGSITMIIVAFLYIVFAIGGYFAMHKLISKKLNL